MSHQRALAEDPPRSNWKNDRGDWRTGRNGWKNEHGWRDERSSRENDLRNLDCRPMGQVERKVLNGQATHRRTRPRLRKPVAIAVLVVGLYLFTGYVSGFVKIASLHHQIAQTRREIADVQEKNKQLQMRIAELNSPAYAEKVARETLGLVKKGEVKYMVAEPIDKQDPAYLEVQKRPGSKEADSFY